VRWWLARLLPAGVIYVVLLALRQLEQVKNIYIWIPPLCVCMHSVSISRPGCSPCSGQATGGEQQRRRNKDEMLFLFALPWAFLVVIYVGCCWGALAVRRPLHGERMLQFHPHHEPWRTIWGSGGGRNGFDALDQVRLLAERLILKGCFLEWHSQRLLCAFSTAGNRV